MADYLEKEHWQNASTDGKRKIINEGFIRETREQEEMASKARQRELSSIEDLEAAIKLTRKGKEPSPDNIRMELIKLLARGNRIKLLSTKNEWRANKTAPNELYHVRVAPIIRRATRQGVELQTNFSREQFLQSLHDSHQNKNTSRCRRNNI